MTNYYVRPSFSGTHDGTSWATAWNNIAGINWGSLGGGDTLYVAAGTYSGQMALGSSGDSNTSRLTIRAAQDTYVGIAYFPSDIYFSGVDYITVDGEKDGSRMFDVTGYVDASYNAWPIVRYVTIHGDSVGIAASAGASGDDRRAQFSYNYLYDIRRDAGINLTGRNLDQAGYDYILIDHNDINLNCYTGEDGGGPDGIQVHAGATIEYNTFRNTVGTVVAGQHQDFIQLMGGYSKIRGNVFLDGADSNIDNDLTNGDASHDQQIYNNVFVKRRGGASIRYYFGPRAFTNILIANNLFIDHTSGTNYDNAIVISANVASSLTNVLIKNNIFYNVTSEVVSIDSNGGTAADWNFDYNLVNAGPHGVTGVTLDGASYTQAHPRTAAPSFSAYVEDDYASSDYHLAINDTAATNQGTDLSAYFTIDKDGVTRPGGVAWDLGPYETSGAPQGFPVLTVS